MARDDKNRKRNSEAKKLSKKISENPEISEDVWILLKEEGRDSFESSLDWGQLAASTSIEMIKISLLIGSLFVAIFQFELVDSLPVNGLGVIIAIFFLFSSIVSYIIGYNTIGDVRISGNIESLHDYVNDDQEKKEVLQSLAFDYFFESGENNQTIQRANHWVTTGTICLAASAGSMTAVVML